MPRIVQLPQSKGKYGGASQAIANILTYIGKVERLRQERSLNAKIINAVATGGGMVGPQQIAEIIAQNQPEYATGPTGFLQKIAGQFAPPSMLERQYGGALMQQALQPKTPFTLTPGAQRFTAEGKKIAEVPPIKAGPMQIATIDDGTGLIEGTVYQSDKEGNVRVISEAGGGDLSLSDKKKLAVSESARFRSDQRIKNYQIIERSEKGMVAALKKATAKDVKSRIAADQALGVLFQKMLDPESVVRESEYARTPEGAAAINRILAVAPQLRLGGLKLLDEDRQALVDMAQALLDGAKVSANQAYDEFEARANKLGLDKTIVFGTAKRYDITAPAIDELSQIEKEIAELEALK